MLLTFVTVVFLLMLVSMFITLAGYLPVIPSTWQRAIGVAGYPDGDVERRPVTLWVWLSALFVPVTVGVVGIYFAYTQQQSVRAAQKEQAGDAMAVQKQQAKDEAFQGYLDDMSALLTAAPTLNMQYPTGLCGGYGSGHSAVSFLAQARTRAVLDIVGPSYKGAAVQFLFQGNLITRQDTSNPLRSCAVFVRLDGDNLVRADLSDVYLANAYLRYVRLNHAKLTSADLRGSDLSRCYLNKADLSGADLRT